jgi:hypothetical protein
MDTPKTMLDYEVSSAKVSVRSQEIKVREARSNLDNGYLEAKAELERKYLALKCALETAEAELDRNKAWLALKESEQEKGFSEI